MPHILVVCTTNICRSPVGEAILRDRLQKRGLEQWSVSSAGTWAQIERGAARYSQELMAEQGLNLKDHRARLIKRSYLKKTDLVLCMESGHAEALRAEFPSFSKKIYLLSEMIDKSYSIQDPFGQPIDAYRTMVAELTKIIDGGLDKIIKLAEENAEKRRR